MELHSFVPSCSCRTDQQKLRAQAAAQQAAAQAAAAQAAAAQGARAGLTPPPGSIAAPGVRVRGLGPSKAIIRDLGTGERSLLLHICWLCGYRTCRPVNLSEMVT